MSMILCLAVVLFQSVAGVTDSDACEELTSSFQGCLEQGYKAGEIQPGIGNKKLFDQACSTLQSEMEKRGCSFDWINNFKPRERRNVIQKRDSGFCSGNLCYRMDTGALLPIGSSLVSANGRYELRMQTDNNLVLYCYAGNAIWHSSTYGMNIDGGLRLKKDGSLELTEIGTGHALWKSNVLGGEMLYLQNDGNLVLYNVQEQNIWETGTDLDYCEEGYCSGDRCVRGSARDVILKLGESLISQNGNYDLRMQTDGNLVVYCYGGTPIWHSATYGRSVTGGLEFQLDSNLVIYDPDPIWASGTHHSGATTLVMQNDGNVVMYTQDGTPVWHTDTYNKC